MKKIVIEIECSSESAVDEVINEVNDVVGRHIKIDSVRFAVDGWPLSRVHLFAMRGGMSYTSMRANENELRNRAGRGPLLDK